MYNNIGRKIKGLATVIVGAGMILTAMGGLISFFVLSDNYRTEDMAFLGIIVMIVGPILCWLSGFFIYGFGELVDQTQQINTKLSGSKNDEAIKEKIAKLKEWREKGLVTEEEFQEKLASL